MTFERIGMIEKTDLEQWYELLEQISEISWGDDNSEREPFGFGQTIEVLREMSEKALAWDELYSRHESNSSEPSEEDWVMIEMMDGLLEDVIRD